MDNYGNQKIVQKKTKTVLKIFKKQKLKKNEKSYKPYKSFFESVKLKTKSNHCRKSVKIRI